MNDTGQAACLIQCEAEMQEMIQRWFLHGDNDHAGRGIDFVQQMAFACICATIGISYIRSAPTRAETDRLNALIQSSRFGFAALPVPRDEVVMMALLPAFAFFECQRRHATGDMQTAYANSSAYREAARMAMRLHPGEPSRKVKAWAEATDEQLSSDEYLATLQSFAPGGKAN